jgi:hypothetical protein
MVAAGVVVVAAPVHWRAAAVAPGAQGGCAGADLNHHGDHGVAAELKSVPAPPVVLMYPVAAALRALLAGCVTLQAALSPPQGQWLACCEKACEQSRRRENLSAICVHATIQQ